MASYAIRCALEQNFGVKLVFRNCHRVAVFRADNLDADRYAKFTSIRGRLLNQSPTLRDC